MLAMATYLIVKLCRGRAFRDIMNAVYQAPVLLEDLHVRLSTYINC